VNLEPNSGSLERTNYYFAGWSLNGVTYTAGAAYSLTGDVTATPVWAQYTITYAGTDKTGGSSPTDTLGVGTVTVEGAGTLVRTNYYLAGWFIGGVNYDFGDALALTQDETATPIWGQYTVYYVDTLGDGGSTPSDTVGYGNITLATNTGNLSLSGGYVFAGWTIGGVDYAAGAQFSLTTDETASARYVLGGFGLHYLDTDADGGSAPGDQSGVTGVTLPNAGSLTRTNFYFVGWSIGGVTYTPGTYVPLSSSENASPVWAQYTITYLDTDADGGTAPSGTSGVGSIYLDGTGGTLTRTNYYLQGWIIGGTTYQLGDAFNLTGDETASPVWSQYTLSYSDTPSTAGEAPQPVLGVGTITLSANTGSLVRTGYILAGWVIGGTNYSFNGSYALTSNEIAYPRWVQYAITYNSASANGGSTPSNLTWAGSYTLPGNTGNLTRSGYGFAGWVIGGVNYAPGETANITGATTIFARWLRCGITYSAPDKTSGSVPGALSGCNAIVIAKNSGNLARTGYYFAGWSINGVTYQPGERVTPDSGLTATAVWARYTITYLDAEATSGTVPANTLGYGTTALATNTGNLQRTNYYFAGWVLGSVEYTVGSNYSLRGNVFAFAKWKQYKINYVAPDKTSGSISADAISFGYLSIPVATYGTLAKTGYLFAGWLINGQTYQPRSTFNLTGNVTATAQWSRCVITYNDGYSTGGNIPGSTEGCSNVLANPGTLSRSNFYFAGWVVEGVLHQPGETVEISGHRTAYAKWLRYSLTFLGTGADSGTAPTPVNGYGTVSTPRAIGTLAKAGYYIAGWVIGGANYAFGTSISLTSDLTAEPIWAQYSITYNSTTLYVGTMPNRSYGFGATTVVNAPNISRVGYTFAGWVIGGATYAVGSDYVLRGNVTAYAKWVKTR
jgi:uncharacterized repeat protein (TIGR02543 family)